MNVKRGRVQSRFIRLYLTVNNGNLKISNEKKMTTKSELYLKSEVILYRKKYVLWIFLDNIVRIIAFKSKVTQNDTCKEWPLQSMEVFIRPC